MYVNGTNAGFDVSAVGVRASLTRYIVSEDTLSIHDATTTVAIINTVIYLYL